MRRSLPLILAACLAAPAAGQAPRWELWSEGSANATRLAVAPDHGLYHSNLASRASGGPRVFHAPAEAPRTFTQMTANGFAMAANQLGAASLTTNLASEPVIAVQSQGPADGIFWRFDRPTQTWTRALYNGGRGNWDSCRQVVRGADGKLWFGAVYADAGVSSDDGASFDYLSQTVPPGAPAQPSKVFACAIGPPEPGNDTGSFYTFTEITGTIFSADGGRTWDVPDPANDTSSPAHRIGYGFQNGSAGLALADGRVQGTCGNSRGYGGGDDVHTYLWDRMRPDLPAVVVDGIAPGWFDNSNNVVDGQSVQARSGAVVMSCDAYPRDAQGGLYWTLDGFHWQAANDGIRFPFVANAPQLQVFFREQTNSVGSLAASGDDVFFGTSSGQVWHWLVPGALSVAGTVRDDRGAPLAGVEISTDLGQRSVSGPDGSYLLNGVGRSHFPLRLRARLQGWAFGWPDLFVRGAETGVAFSGAPALLAGVVAKRSLEDYSGLVGVGGQKRFEARLLDQFGHPLDVASPPAVAWSVTPGTGDATIDSSGLLVGTMPGIVSATATVGVFTSSDVAVVNAANPGVTSVTPVSGPRRGGTDVTITGAGFTTIGTVSADFGGIVVGCTALDAATITCTTPAFYSDGLITVSVVNTVGGVNSSGSLLDAFTYTDTPGSTRFLTVVAGSEQGTGATVVQASAGQVVSLVADPPPPGQEFHQWTGTHADIADDTSPSTTLVMPARDASIVATYRLVPTLAATATPTIDPPGGAFTSEQWVTLACATPGSRIFYTLDGSDPVTDSRQAAPHGARYVGPFRVGASLTVKAVASAANRPDSPLASADFDFAAPLPVVTIAPMDLSACAGSVVQLDVVATGTGALAYRWRRDGAPLADDGRVRGSGTPRLVLDGALASDAGDYDCVVTDANGVATSLAAALTIDATRSAPGEVVDLRVVRGVEADLSWTAPSDGGLALTYDVLRSTSPSRWLDATATSCLATRSALLAATDPSTGTAYYLVSARNACSPWGLLGRNSFGAITRGRLCM